MKITQKLTYLLLALPIFLTSCGGNDSNDVSGDKTTVNANANGTDKSPYATRIEVPRVMKGNNYLFLAKTTQDLNDGVNYCIEWDCMKRGQRWTCWMWDKQNSQKGWVRNNWSTGAMYNGYGGQGDPFQPDLDIPDIIINGEKLKCRTDLSDYSGSGYNRGHMCASEDRICSKEVNGQTFYLSNMHPQIGGHNSGIWSTIEGKVRNWRDAVVNAGGVMYICKGGTINDVTINGKTSNGVIKRISGNSEYEMSSSQGMPVPKYFYMAILKKTASGLYSAVGIWTEHKVYNDYKNISDFMISIDELEARTGIDFFCNLPDNLENAAEANLDTSEWK